MKTSLPLAVLLLVLAACGDTDGADTTPVSTTQPTQSTASTQPVTTQPIVPESTLAEISLDAWLGTYSWVEFVEGDPGSDQTLVHELSLSERSETSLIGTLSQNGFQTSVELTVTARIADGFVEVSVVSVDDGVSSYSPGDMLFELSGDPAAPTTIIESLATLTQPVQPGNYFVQGSAAVDIPDTDGPIWVVDADTFDLVLIDPASSDAIQTITGWGADFVDPDTGPIQALQTVEVDARGRIWVDDCCEPAFGNTFGIDPETDMSIEEAQIRLFGLTPRVSPSGDRVAIGIGDLGVGVFDTSTGETVVDPGTIYSLTTDAEFTFLTPIAWADDTTLAIAVPAESTFTVAFVDLTDPSTPMAVGSSGAIDGVVLDGDFRADGTVAVLIAPDRTETRRMVIITPPTAAVIEVVELPDGTAGIDYDARGDNLLLLTADGALRTFGADGVVAGPFIDAAR